MRALSEFQPDMWIKEIYYIIENILWWKIQF